MTHNGSGHLTDPRDPGPEIFVVNEFSAVRVRKVRTRGGERLEITALHDNRSVRLDALALESLTWRSVLEISEGLRTPFGPEGGS